VTSFVVEKKRPMCCEKTHKCDAPSSTKKSFEREEEREKETVSYSIIGEIDVVVFR